MRNLLLIAVVLAGLLIPTGEASARWGRGGGVYVGPSYSRPYYYNYGYRPYSNYGYRPYYYNYGYRPYSYGYRPYNNYAPRANFYWSW